MMVKNGKGASCICNDKRSRKGEGQKTEGKKTKNKREEDEGRKPLRRTWRKAVRENI
jgi:hypothetical protein